MKTFDPNSATIWLTVNQVIEKFIGAASRDPNEHFGFR
jgi:hypothetical protein